jgi:hypothetical protein
LSLKIRALANTILEGGSKQRMTSRTGRLRWKIENEGFNTLKKGGYESEESLV